MELGKTYAISQTGTFRYGDFEIGSHGVAKAVTIPPSRSLSPHMIPVHGHSDDRTPSPLGDEIYSKTMSPSRRHPPPPHSREEDEPHPSSPPREREDDEELTITEDDVRRPLSADDLYDMGVVGKGICGSVSKALHFPSLSCFALKRINVYQQDTRRQLLHELKAYSALKNDNIVSFLGAYFDSNRGDIVMASEFMDCGSLAGFVQKYGPIAEIPLRHIFRQVVRGLDYLHSQHYLHRDIKPDNLLLHHDSSCKIADFGLVTQLNGTTDQMRVFAGTSLSFP